MPPPPLLTLSSRTALVDGLLVMVRVGRGGRTINVVEFDVGTVGLIMGKVVVAALAAVAGTVEAADRPGSPAARPELAAGGELGRVERPAAVGATGVSDGSAVGSAVVGPVVVRWRFVAGAAVEPRGAGVGVAVGLVVGFTVGPVVRGAALLPVGTTVGGLVGMTKGFVAATVGGMVGTVVGICVGAGIGNPVGICVGDRVGTRVGTVGVGVGA